jgi:hypothetical protein
LLGSLHVLTEDAYPLPPAINKAFAESKTLVEEADPDEMNDPMQMMAALAKAMLVDGRTLDQWWRPRPSPTSDARGEGRRRCGDPAHEAVARRHHADGADAAGRRLQGRVRRRPSLFPIAPWPRG